MSTEEISKDACILVVEDSPENITILNEILKTNYKIKVAINGKSALKIANNHPIDLVLLDINLPDTDGYTICEQLKSEESTRDIPVIFITAKNNTEDETKGFTCGAVDYITKPIVPAVVLARVKSQLQLKAAQERLARQNKKLESILQLQEDLTHMIIHDMRTPLVSILSSAELLHLKKGVREDCQRYVAMIKKATNSLNDFINDILMLAKSESGTVVLNRKQTDLKKMLLSIKEIHNNIAELKEINIYVKTPGEDVAMDVDEKLLKRVIDNLVANALKFSPPQSTITLGITKIASDENYCYQLQVCDEGPGIPAEQRETIFSRFSTVEMQKKDALQVGLGLTFCKMVVDAHGGKIFVKDNTPQGSIFHIEI